MRTFIVLITLVASVKSMACSVELLAKKPDAKTFYSLEGKTVSLKKAQELASYGCTVKARLMSSDELHAIELTRAKAKLEKLQKGPQQAGSWFQVK